MDQTLCPGDILLDSGQATMVGQPVPPGIAAYPGHMRLDIVVDQEEPSSHSTSIIHGAGQEAQIPLEDVRPSGHPHEVCF